MKKIVLLFALSIAACSAEKTTPDCHVSAVKVAPMCRVGADCGGNVDDTPEYQATAYVQVCDGGYMVAQCYRTIEEVPAGESYAFDGYYCQGI